MAEVDLMQEISKLTARSKELNARRAKVHADRSTVLAELEASRRTLRKLMDAAEKAGYDPDNMKDELARKIEVERTKQAVFESDIASAEAILRPMLEEIRKA